jgi:hypothetical protein
MNFIMINFWADLKEEFPRIFSLAAKRLLSFTSVYVYETMFSTCAATEVKYHSRLNGVHDMSIRRSDIVDDFEPGFDSRSGHERSVVHKVALELVFSEYFGFPCKFSFHQRLYAYLSSSGAGTIGQIVASVPSGLGLIPSYKLKKKRWLQTDRKPNCRIR